MIPSLIRVQPVEPEPLPPARLNAQIVGAVATLFLGSLFVMLAVGVLNDLYPQVPRLGYWQTVVLLLGLNVVTRPLTGRTPPFKWARR